MAEVVLQSIQEAVAGLVCTCDTCNNQEHLAAALVRALASAEQLVKNLDDL